MSTEETKETILEELALDTETTGLKVEEGHRIVSIGIVEMRNRIRTGRLFYVLINPKRDIPAEASKIHGLTNELLKDKPEFKTIAKDLMLFLSGRRLVIHNAVFDLSFLNTELKQAGMDIIPSSQVVCTYTLARKYLPLVGASLNSLCKHFNVDVSHRILHSSLIDAELLCEMYTKFVKHMIGYLIFILRERKRHGFQITTGP
jgi:DNA polymerase III subunit epsilon